MAEPYTELTPLDIQSDDAPQKQETSETPSRNLVTRKGFDHAKCIRLWEARARFCEESDKQNEKDYKEAENWFRGGDQETSGTSVDDRTTADSKFAGNIFKADVDKLVSFLMHQDSKTSCKPGRDPAMKPLADATQALADIAAREGRYREQKKKAFIEALLRNHGYVRQGWDHYNWLPSLSWTDGEVRLDPDCGGDIRRARFLIEEFTTTLDALMEDEEIPQDIRDELKERREIHKATRVPEWQPNTNERDRADKEMQTWDSQPGFTKVVCYRIWSREGLLPGVWDDQDIVGDSINDQPDGSGGKFLFADEGPTGRKKVINTNPNASFGKPPPEIRDDAVPAPPEFDPLEHGRRVYILMVREFHKVLKVTDWPMDHYRRDEFPYVEIRFSDLPGDLHGVSIFRTIRPHLKAINKVFETWIADKRHGARRIVEIEEEIADDTEIEKIEKGAQWEAVRVKHIGGIKPTKFDVGDQSYETLIPALMKLHDDASGVNDVIRGRAGDVSKTATEAQKLDDNAAAALGYLEDAIERFEDDETRMRVSAIQRYVPKESIYPGCPTCGVPGEGGKILRGSGMVPNPEPVPPMGLGLDVGSSSDMVPCPMCASADAPAPTMLGQTGTISMQPQAPPEPQAGHGWDPEAVAQGRPLVKGADFWLDQQGAAAWRDDLSLDQIRAEIIVSVKKGSSRRDYREREVGRLRNAGQDLVPFYQKLGPVGLHYWREYVSEVAEAVGVEHPAGLVPTDEEIAQAAQAMTPPPTPPAPPPPPPDPIDQQAKIQDAQRKDAELALKHNEVQGRQAIEARRLALEEAKAQAEMAPHQAATQGVQQAMAGAQQVTQMLAQAMAGLTQAVEAIQVTVQNGQEGAASVMKAATAIQQANEANVMAIMQAAKVLEAASVAPKKVTIQRGPDGKIAGAIAAPAQAAV